MKKVLIITYYWIPSGGAGVQRWVKFTKYLREFGCEPIIYTPENPEYPSEDFSFEKDIPADIQIIKKPIWEPYDIYRKLTGKKNQRINAGFITENTKQSKKDKISIWIRGNFLIPDPRRFWIKPSVEFLMRFIAENQIDTVITTGPPHSMHMIGLGLKKKNPALKWVADFRDPWTNIDFYKELRLNVVSDRIHHRLEQKVIQSADAVLVVSNGMKDEFEMLNPRKLEVITNGYDTEDSIKQIDSIDSEFSLSHIGTLNAARNPVSLWKALGELMNEIPGFSDDLKIKLVGKTDYSVFAEIERNGLGKQFEKVEYLSHAEAIRMQAKSQVLLLLINKSANAKGILTGKFFEYLAAGRPILAVGPSDGDVAHILNESQAGIMIGFDDVEHTKKAVLEFYSKYKQGNLHVQPSGVDQYSRHALTGKLVQLLKTL